MGKQMVVDKDSLTPIANLFREVLEIPREYHFPLSEFESMINGALSKTAGENYQQGYEDGKSQGTDEAYWRGYGDGTNNGIEIGKEQGYGEFEDGYTENGTQTVCDHMYAGRGWNVNTFKPKNKLTPTSAHRMFAYHNRQANWNYPEYDLPTDKFDFSKVTDASYMFQNARFVTVDVDLSSATNLDYCFDGSNGGRVRHLFVKIISKANFIRTFTYLTQLQTFRLKEGSVIQHNYFDIRQSTKLDKESFVSIVNALSASTSGYSIHLSLVAVNKAFETSAGANNGSTSAEWLALVGTRTNWTISLV